MYDWKKLYYNRYSGGICSLLTISVRLSEEDTKLIKAYAEMNNTTLSDLIRNAIIEKIEDEYDLKCYEKAIEEYKKNPVTYTHEQVAQLLELE